MRANARTLILAAIAVGLITPLLAYAWLMHRAPSVPADVALELLKQPGEAVLLDLREKRKFDEWHLSGAINVSEPDTLVNDAARFNELSKGTRRVLLICDLDYLSSGTAKRLIDKGYSNVAFVRGGIDGLIKRGKVGNNPYIGGGPVEAVSFSVIEQLMIVIAAFGLKPLYEITSLLLAIMLWKARAEHLVALRNGLLAFFVGETACAVNFLFFNEQSTAVDFVHTYGMAVSFSFFAYAAMVFIEQRVIRAFDEKRACAFVPLCGRCYKQQDVPCTFRHVMLFAVPATALLALMPLTAPLDRHYQIGFVFGDMVLFGPTFMHQAIDSYYYPLVSLPLFAASLWLLVRNWIWGDGAWRVLYCMGLGPLGFALMRFMLVKGYSGRPIWAEIWEEATEFLFIAFVLWIVLRLRRLEPREFAMEEGSRSRV